MARLPKWAGGMGECTMQKRHAVLGLRGTTAWAACHHGGLQRVLQGKH